MIQNAFYFLLLLITADSVIYEKCYINRTDTDPPLPSPPPIKVINKTYIIETSFLASWYKAEQFCRLHGMNLASINNQEEDDGLRETIESFGLSEFKFWTSGNDLDHDSSYVWQSTGSSFSFTDWMVNQPDNAPSENQTEHCVEVYNIASPGGWWNDCICSSRLYFICEI